jgi:hypothetical protein
VDADLDTVATALYVTIDDLLKRAPHLAPWRPTVGIAPKLSDAELVTLAVMQALPGFTSDARWLRHAHAHLRHLFPYLPQQPGYNKRLRAATDLLQRVVNVLARDTTLWTDDVWVGDSTPVECGRSTQTVHRSELAGWAQYGDCASHSRDFWGLRLHLVCTLHGLPVAFALTGAKADERQVLLGILHADPTEAATEAAHLTHLVPGERLRGCQLVGGVCSEVPSTASIGLRGRTWMRLGLASSILGTTICSTPPSTEASMASAITRVGSVIERLKAP